MAMFTYAVIAALLISSAIHLAYLRLGSKRYLARDVFKLDRRFVVDRGGYPLYLSMVAVLVTSYLLGVVDSKLIYILISLSLAFLAGLIDDLFPSLPGYYKPLAATAPALPIIIGGLYNPSLRIFDGYVFNIPIIYPLLLLGGFMIALNAVNMLDVINGSASTGVYIVLTTLAFSSIIRGDPPTYTLLFLAVLTPFLILNVYPASIFLGNSGALLIGSLIPISAVVTSLEVVALFAMYPFLVNGLFYLLRFKAFVERRAHGYKVAALGEDGLIHDMCEEGAPLVLLKFLVASKPKSELRVWIEMSILFVVSGLMGMIFIFI